MFDIDKICLIGGDMRQVYLGRLLAQDGKFVTYYALEDCADAQPDFASLSMAVSRCDAVILPMPLSKDGKELSTPLSELKIPLDEKLAKALSGKRIFCANAELLKSTGDYSHSEIYDYLAREELAVMNAVPTAEGAIAEAVELSERTLHGSRCLIVGFGRIGKVLSRDLRALGANVAVSARKPADLAWVKSCGYESLNTSDLAGSGGYDFIFNTVPAMVLNKETLLRIARKAVVIDLASKPGGTDFEACRELHIPASAALGLPGKTAPLTAAEIIRQTIYNIAQEESS